MREFWKSLSKKLKIRKIGIGIDYYRPRPCHITRHADRHRAVREMEVTGDEVPR